MSAAERFHRSGPERIGEPDCGLRRDAMISEQLQIASDGAAHGLDMNDSVDDVDHKSNGSRCTRTSNYVRAWYDTVRTRCLVEEGPGQTALVHSVEVDQKINRLGMLDVHRYVLFRVRFMITVRSTIGPEVLEPREPLDQVPLEGNRDVRGPKGWKDLKSCVEKSTDGQHDEHREAFKLVGCEVVDLSVGSGVERRQSPAMPRRKPSAESLSLAFGGFGIEVVAADDDNGVVRDRCPANPRLRITWQHQTILLQDDDLGVHREAPSEQVVEYPD